jgi:hypothetical protein
MVQEMEWSQIVSHTTDQTNSIFVYKVVIN